MYLTQHSSLKSCGALLHKYDVEDNVEDEDETADVPFIVCVALSLIVLTVGFESGKHHLQHHCDRIMRPIVDSLFAEMTVLGFVSLFLFLVNKAGFFHFLGAHLYGNDSEEALELLEL